MTDILGPRLGGQGPGLGVQVLFYKWHTVGCLAPRTHALTPTRRHVGAGAPTAARLLYADILSIGRGGDLWAAATVMHGPETREGHGALAGGAAAGVPGEMSRGGTRVDRHGACGPGEAEWAVSRRMGRERLYPA